MSKLFNRFITSLILLFLIYLALINSYVLFLLLFFISYFAIIEFNFIFTKIFKNKNLTKFISLFISLGYITSFSLIILIYLFPLNYNNNLSIVFLLIICTSTDIGGFVIGKLVGGKKITKISPNKTFSGVIGSFLFSLVFGNLFIYHFSNKLNYEINIILMILFISLVSQIGDLTISFLKRKAKIKDSGSILPGHGGILDRIDGILLALPIGIILISS